jgi:hypothetical protein
MKKILQALFIITVVQLSFDISGACMARQMYPGFAEFKSYVIGGNVQAVQSGINSPSFDSAELALALALSVFYEHLDIVAIILQRRDEISLEEIDESYEAAVYQNRMDIAHLLHPQD